MPDSRIQALIGQVAYDRLRHDLFALCQDPLPFRKLNYTVPGHEKCSLYEADDFIAAELAAAGYAVEREPCQVQCYRCDSSKPKAHQYSPPEPDDPWYTAYNLLARKAGTDRADEIIVIVAHKDSQSWVDSPGALDNAVGTVGALEIARLVAGQTLRRSVWLIFCNEEHTPWTSAAAAQACRDRGDNLVAIVNLDAIAGRTQEAIDQGIPAAFTAYTEEPGRAIAEHIHRVNEEYGIGLVHTIARREFANDDDGSFVKAGFPAAVVHIGSWPYGDPNYHTEEDTPERVDVRVVQMSIQAVLGTVLEIAELCR
ncbi:MAG TPA: M28 family peptidase [Armatimonadota bacterium]|nr:M28 family peptidase [Armatimonadota bacterium]